MFWLSYESFSILYDVFCQKKGHFQQKQKCICFWFQSRFWKNIICFWFWWKTYTKCCTYNYVIWGLLHFVVDQMFSISGKLEEHYLSRNIEVKIWIKIWILIFFLVLFNCWLSLVSVVPASCFNYSGPCRCFQLVVDGFSSF